MISYKKWKEECDDNHRLYADGRLGEGRRPRMPLYMRRFWHDDREASSQQEPEPPQLADFKGFINDRMAPRQNAATDARLQSVSEFVGDLASFPKAKERIEYLNSHGDIRDDLMAMNQSDWDRLESTLDSMHPKDHQRMGHALRWLHMHMKGTGSKYNRRDNNLGQWAAKFRKPRSPKS